MATQRRTIMPLSFDPTGILPANKVINEEHTVLFAGDSNPYLILPVQGPFYKDGFSIVDENGITLREGEHFFFSHLWQDAITAIGKQIYGSVALIGLTVSGTYRVNCQYVGGSYPSGNAYASEGFHALSTGQLFLLDWENTPDSFPHTNHTHPLVSGFEGMKMIHEDFRDLIEAINAPEGAIRLDDIEDLGSVFVNPVMMALNQIVSVLSGSTMELGQLAAIQLQLTKLIPWATVPVDLSFYDVPLAGFFKVKTGKINYDPAILSGPGSKPTAITFPVAFANQCLYCNIQVHMEDDTLVQEHKVVHSKPKKEGISTLQIEPISDAHPTGIRTITYWAIGL